MESIFPKDMLRQTELSMETVAARLSYFYLELRLLHWQTQSYAEHIALGSLYDYIHSFTDGVLEKLMGYTGRRVNDFKIEPISGTTSATVIVSEIIIFAHNLMTWADNNQYCDVSNLAQSLSGEASKTRYLLTLT